MSRVPRIRFKGFKEDWEQRKLGEVCNIITKQTGFDYSSTIKPALLKEKADNTYPFIQNKDFNGTTINMDTDFFIPISVAEKFPNIVLDRPSLLISISGRIGNVGFYSCVHKAFIGGAVGICKLKYNDDGKFIIHELESEYGQKYFHLLIKASSHANITVEDIRNMELIFPNKKEEKVYISTFFSTLDHLITLHQRKLEKLKIIKKSMLENLFPQNGEKTPKIRFSGFTKDWEQRKLGEIGSVAMCRRIFKYQTTESGDIPFFKIGSFGGTPDAFISKDLFESFKVKYPYPEKGDVLISASGSIGRTVVFTGKDEYFQDSNIVWLKHNNNIINSFLNYLYSIVKWTGIEGTTVKRLYNDNILKTEAIIPTLLEQQKISDYLDGINHLITLHQSKSFGHILKVIVSCTLSWEQRKLGEYLIQYTEVTIINDQYPVLTSSRKGIFFQKDYYDGNQIASENNIGYNIVPYGYFTYRHMSDDEIFYFNINNIIDNGIVSTLYPVFTTNDRLDSKFLQYELNFGKEFRKYSVLQKQGGSRTYMYFNKLRDLKLTITTSLKEQECIRNLICSIDHLITLHQGKLEKLQKIKKSMLESMFV